MDDFSSSSYNNSFEFLSYNNSNLATTCPPISIPASQRNPRDLNHQQGVSQSTAPSVHNLVDEFPDHINLATSPAYLSWATSSLCGSSTGMTGSPRELRSTPVQFQQGQPLEPYTAPTATSPLFEHDSYNLNPPYENLNLDWRMGTYNYAGYFQPPSMDPSFVQPHISPTVGTPNMEQNFYFDTVYAQPSALSFNHPLQQYHATYDPPSTSPTQLTQIQSHISDATSPVSSRHSTNARSPSRRGSSEGAEDGRAKHQCPYPDCGRKFKDLKAHMLTHQDERPEKCPISSCEFHKRGFARRYDRNRHLVTTHYKSTIVCGFCPGSGTAAEKSFNRTDVFKRHLVAVHGVENTPPNGRKKSPNGSGRQSPTLPDGTTGKCSTCSMLFNNPQDLFEHLDDCVLRVVQQVDPAEANNERALMSVAEDDNVKNTIKLHGLENASDMSMAGADEEEGDDDAARLTKSNIRSSKAATTQTKNGVRDGRINKHTAVPKNGLTFSKGGVPLNLPRANRRAPRREYPRSWGCAPDTMKLRKRVLCVFDGSRRTWKDDMMLGNEHEVRVPLDPEGEKWVTDLDVQTMNRAEAFHGATEEEKGPWNGMIEFNPADMNFEPPQFM